MEFTLWLCKACINTLYCSVSGRKHTSACISWVQLSHILSPRGCFQLHEFSWCPGKTAISHPVIVVLRSWKTPTDHALHLFFIRIIVSPNGRASSVFFKVWSIFTVTHLHICLSLDSTWISYYLWVLYVFNLLTVRIRQHNTKEDSAQMFLGITFQSVIWDRVHARE